MDPNLVASLPHASLIVLATQIDPTGTGTLRAAYGAEIKKRIKTVIRDINISIVENDCFGIVGPFQTHVALTPKRFAFATDAEKLAGFTAWLEATIQEEILGTGTTAPRWQRRYIDQAYLKGVDAAERILIASAEVEKTLQTVLQSPFNRRRLEIIASRDFSELKNITDFMSNRINSEIALGLMYGESPRAMARRITKIAGISLKRAEVLVRTEIIHANAEATLDTYERYGIEGIKVKAEWVTAGYNVCRQCSKREGKVYTLKRARGLIPFHPNCRCTWVPVVVR